MTHVTQETIDVATLASSEVLAGGSKGMSDLAKLVSRIPTSPSPVVIALDFRRIKVATSSYLREFAIGFRNYCSQTRPEAYPVIANANMVIVEELRTILSSMRDAIVLCQLRDGTRVTEGRVIGVLDEKEEAALVAVLHSPGIDAVALAGTYKSSDNVSANAWSNRLAGLVQKRILVEERDGRRKRFVPVLKELEYGC
ncbi:MAG TPA: hypothetical protein VFB96_18745 [Pirellulaceae bacterium]|nr:hypothetical protein [Pirellulaceae bacterium]